MRAASRLGASASFALRRLRANRLQAAITTLALVLGSALIGVTTILVAVAQEEHARSRVEEATPAERAIQIAYTIEPGRAGRAGARAASQFAAELGAPLTPFRVVRIVHGRDFNLFWTPRPERDVVVETGRLPRACDGRTCEALSLGHDLGVGTRIERPGRPSFEIVGSGVLHPAAFPDGSEDRVVTELDSEPFLVRSLTGGLSGVAGSASQTVVRTAALDARGVDAADVRALEERASRALVRFERRAPAATGVVPSALLRSIDERATVARSRSLLVAGEAALLVLALAAFVVGAGAADAELLVDQLRTFGGSRTELFVVRAAEALVPAVAAGVSVVVGLVVGARLVARSRGFQGGFVGLAVPREALFAIGALVAAAAVVLAVRAQSRDQRVAPRALEVAALAAVAVIVWQAASTHGLDASRVATDQAIPVVLLLPALTFFVLGAVIVRLLPLLLRAAARASGHGPPSLRLALVAAARQPRVAAAATAFLAVSVGIALFCVDYRASLDRQARDEAMFRAGAPLRVVERGGRPGGAGTVSAGVSSSASDDVTPLTRFRLITPEPPTPVFRRETAVVAASSRSDGRPLELLALPGSRLPDVLGWRPAYASRPLRSLAAAIGGKRASWTGFRIAQDATALRLWLRGDRVIARSAVLQVLGRGEAFRRAALGFVRPTWARARIALSPSLRGGQVVGVDFPPFAAGASYGHARGFVDVAGLEQEVRGHWVPLRGAEWTARANSAGGVVRPLAEAPQAARDAVRFTFRDVVPVLRTAARIPAALDALVSPAIAAEAVDGVVAVAVGGSTLPLRVSAVAERFPTIVRDPTRFAVVDYGTLFAAANFREPGAAPASEAWFWKEPSAGAVDRLRRPPFRLERLAARDDLLASALGDPLANAMTAVLALTAVVAAAVAVLGLLFSTRSAMESERPRLAEYEALGLGPKPLLRLANLRLLLLSLLGLAGGIVASLVTLRLVAALVAVTAGAATPVVPIEPTVAVGSVAAVVSAVAVAAAGGSFAITRRALAERVARRLRR